MLIWEVEGTKPLTPDQSQARTLDQQQKQIRLRKKQLALGKARDREHKLAAQVTSLASKDDKRLPPYPFSDCMGMKIMC